MGSSFIGMAFRCERDRVADALRRRAPDRLCYVSASPNGWTTVLGADFGTSEFNAMFSLAKVVCPACKCGALAWSVHDDDVLLLFPIDAKGKVGKAYNNAPGYFGEKVKRGEYVTAEEFARRLAEIAESPGLKKGIVEALKADILFAQDRLQTLAKPVGIWHTFEWYENLAQREAAGDALIGAETFIHVGENAVLTVPAPPDCPPHLMFPACLYGSSRGVQTAIKRIVDIAWNEESWDAALAGVELVPVQSRPGDILFGLTRPKGNGWRMYAVDTQLSETVFAARKTMPAVEANDRCDAVYLQGMERFWFVTGLLWNSMFPLIWERSRPVKEVWKDYFRAFVRWLPELQKLDPAYAGGGPRFEHDPNFSGLWMGKIRGAASAFSGSIDADEVQGRYGGNLVKALLDKGLVEPDGDRFRVKERVVRKRRK